MKFLVVRMTARTILFPGPRFITHKNITKFLEKMMSVSSVENQETEVWGRTCQYGTPTGSDRIGSDGKTLTAFEKSANKVQGE